MTTEHEQEFSENIARASARYIWKTLGRGIGHLSLMYGAHKGVNFFNKKEENTQPQTFFGRITSAAGSIAMFPVNASKKYLLWQTAEAAAHKFNEPLVKAWDDATPTAENFLAPLLETVVTPVMKNLKEQGFIRYPEPQPFIDSSESTGFFEYLGITGKGQTFSESLDEWWNGPAPTPEPIIDPTLFIESELPKDLTERLKKALSDAATYARENSGEAGKKTAKALEKAYDLSQFAVEFPGKFMDGIEAFCEETQYPLPLVLAALAGTGVLAFVGLRSMFSYAMNMVSVNQNANHNNNQNNVVLNINALVPPPTYVPTQAAKNVTPLMIAPSTDTSPASDKTGLKIFT